MGREKGTAGLENEYVGVDMERENESWGPIVC